MSKSRTVLLQLRRTLDRWYVVGVVALVILAALGGWLAFTEYDDPGTETETIVTDTWTERYWFDHHATVTQPNEVFPEGEQLSGQSTYFTRITPTLEGSFGYAYDASGSGNLDVTVDLFLVLQNAGSDTVYWSVEDSLDSERVTGVSPGEQVTADFAINISDVAERHSAIQDSLGASPGSEETLVRASVQIEGTVNGERVSRSDTYELEINPGTSTYSVANPGTENSNHETTETITTPLDPDPIYLYGLSGLSIASVLGAVALGLAARRELIAPSADEIRRVNWQAQRDEFDDWISLGTIPDRFHRLPIIEMDSLEDLVDVAIDSDRRVIESVRDGHFYVIEGEFLFTYEPPISSHQRTPLPPIEVLAEAGVPSDGTTSDETGSGDEAAYSSE